MKDSIVHIIDTRFAKVDGGILYTIAWNCGIGEVNYKDLDDMSHYTTIVNCMSSERVIKELPMADKKKQ